MVPALWCVFCCLFMVMLETTLSGWGVLFPGAFCLGFYFVAVRDWKTGLAAALFCCLATEVILGRQATMIPLVPFVVYAILLWQKFADRRYLLTQVLPAFVFGGGYAFLCLFLEEVASRGTGAFGTLRGLWGPFLWSTFLAALFLPLLLRVLDLAAVWLPVDAFYRRSRAGA